MKRTRGDLTVIEGGIAELTKKRVGDVDIPPLPPSHNLNRHGIAIYEFICEALILDGKNIKTAAMQITMLAHQWIVWEEDVKLCAVEGRYAVSANGNKFELPHSYNERAAREAIKKDLPEACLTVMSAIESRVKLSKVTDGNQDDLFADLLDHAKGLKSG